MQSRADIALIVDEKVELEQRILTVLRLGTHWATSATTAEKQQYLDWAVPITLGTLIRQDWPAGAEFDKSECESDRVLQLSLDLDPAVLAWGPLSGQRLASLTGAAKDPLRSLRRAAADALAVLIEDARFAHAVIQMLGAVPFFDVELFPSMHCAVMTRFCPSQSFAEAAANPDQAQALAFSLTGIATAASRLDQEVARLVFRECAISVFSTYQDPWQLKHEPGNNSGRLAMCKKSAAAQVKHLPAGWDKKAGRTLLPTGMTAEEGIEEVRRLKGMAPADNMHSAIAALAVAVIRMDVIGRDENQHLLALCDHAHINIKLDRLLNCCPLMEHLHEQLAKTFGLMQILWLKRAKMMSQQEAAALTSGPIARANALRQKGNKAFVEGNLQAALTAYKASLRDNPTDPLLYSNMAAVQLRLGNINEAHNAALSALSHDATNMKAWVRLGDAFREAGRWQLAQLCYQTAIKLDGSDPAVSDRLNAAARNTTHAWIWEEVPAPWEPVAVAKWLGTRAAVRQNQTLPDPLERLMNRSPHAHLSRYMAVQLKQLYCTAVAMTNAKHGAMSYLPALNEWQCGYSDTPGIGHCSGAVKHMISIADAAAYSYSAPITTLSPMVLVEGKPSVADLLQALALTCLQAPLPGNGGRPYKPKSLKMPYRMLYMYAELTEALKAWGINEVVIETPAETQRGSKQCKTDWQGNNYTGQYRPEVIFDLQGCTKKDKNNDQRTNAKPDSSSSSTTQQQPQAAAVGSSSLMAAAAAAAAAAASRLNEAVRLSDNGPVGQQQQQQQQQQKGQAATNSSSGSRTGDQQPAAAGGSAGGGGSSSMQHQNRAGPAAAAAAAAAAAVAAETELYFKVEAPTTEALPASVCKELEDFQQHGGFPMFDSNSSSSSSSRGQRVMPQPGQVTLMDTWDGLSLVRGPGATGAAPNVQRVTLQGFSRQGRVGGRGEWKPRALEWMGWLERAREGAWGEGDREWVELQLRARQRKVEELEKQQRQERRQRRRQ